MFVPVPADDAAIEAGEMRVAHINNMDILLVNLEGTVYAMDDECSHAACSLGDGYLEDGMVECPCHGSSFDPRTGAPHSLPATKPVRVYPVRRAAGGALEIDLPA